MKTRYILAFFLFPLVLFPQNSESKLLHGRIVFSSLNRSPINIINQTQNTGTTNNENGEFEIEVNLGDTLLFSSIQYMPYEIIVDKEILQMESMIVDLVPSVTKLKQVRISNINLSGDLLTDANSVETEIVFDNQTLGFPPPSPEIPIETRRVYAATSGFLDGLVNLVSGRLKRLKMLEEAAALERLVEKASHSLEPDFFVNECNIPEEYLYSFMYFCAEDDYFKNLIAANQKLDLVEFFKQKAEAYRKMKKLNTAH